MPYLSFPRYSFVQPQAADTDLCYQDPMLCLPMSTPTNWSFTAYGHEVGPDVYDGGHGVHFYAIAVAPDATELQSVQTSGPFTAYAPFISSDTFPVEGDTVIGQFSNASYNDSFQARPTEIGECFKLQIILDVTLAGAIIKRYFFGCTTCFRRIAIGECLTTVLNYRCNENMFDFRYVYMIGTTNVYGSYYNTVELPIFLRDPVLNSDAKIYTRSDGSIVKLYERKEEQYILETDMMPYRWLRALDVALSHDHVYMYNKNSIRFDGQEDLVAYQRKDNMEIEYPKGSLTAMGKATCKVLCANPVHLYNNNCA